MTPDIEKLQRLLGGVDLARLRQRLRARFRRDSAAEHFTLNGLTMAERHALESLLGRNASNAGSMRVSRQAFDDILASAGLGDLRSALEALDGPIENTAAQRQTLLDDWERVFATAQDRLHWLLHHAAVANDSRRLLKRLARTPAEARALLADAQRVLDELPGHGIGRSRLAAQTLGDAHALDDGALATLVLRACVPFRTDDEADSRNRDLWAEQGVIVDGLSRPALALNLPHDGRALPIESGEPQHLSLRRLLKNPPGWLVRGHPVFVCENPAIVTLAADELGPRSAPLVCTDGMPAAAQRTLLKQLVGHGAQLHYHGDFDWPGLRIGNWVIQRFHAQSWRFGANDYRPSGRLHLEGSPVFAVWDAELSAAMQTSGIAVHEEAVADALIDDLRAAA